ncbi:hypothetical protein BN3661_00614 [Eubacteriaceae bacterium CHKCI005]|nr:hypothetical protein BN3661_00614 [Eubacteriaceae bacterium CHKCI005]
MKTIQNIAKGFLIGIGSIAPGVSGGSIAVIFGIYDKLTDAVAHFYRNFKEKIKFLWPLIVGGALGVLLFSNVIQYLFENYNTQIRCLFIGLMIGTFPAVVRQANDRGFRKSYLIWAGVAFIVTAVLAILNQINPVSSGPMNESFIMLFLSGAIIGFGTIIPGISASFILMALGAYETLLHILTSFDILSMLPIALGLVVSILLFAKLVSYLYQRAYGIMSYIVFGLLAGSVLAIVPPFEGNMTTIVSLLLMIAGLIFSYLLSTIPQRNKKAEKKLS